MVLLLLPFAPASCSVQLLQLLRCYSCCYSDRIAIAEGKTLKTSAVASLLPPARRKQSPRCWSGRLRAHLRFDGTYTEEGCEVLVRPAFPSRTHYESRKQSRAAGSFTVCGSCDIAAAKAAAVEAAAAGCGWQRPRSQGGHDLVDVVGIRDKGGTKESYPHAPVPILDLVDRLRSQTLA